MAIVLKDLDFIGTDVDLRFVIGQLVDIAIEVVDDAGAVVNISGRTYTAEIGPDIALGSEAGAYSFAQVDTDLTNGRVNLTLDTSAVTTAGRYRWTAWEDGNNLLWQGTVEAQEPNVT